MDVTPYLQKFSDPQTQKRNEAIIRAAQHEGGTSIEHPDSSHWTVVNGQLFNLRHREDGRWHILGFRPETFDEAHDLAIEDTWTKAVHWIEQMYGERHAIGDRAIFKLGRTYHYGMLVKDPMFADQPRETLYNFETNANDSSFAITVWISRKDIARWISADAEADADEPTEIRTLADFQQRLQYGLNFLDSTEIAQVGELTGYQTGCRDTLRQCLTWLDELGADRPAASHHERRVGDRVTFRSYGTIRVGTLAQPPAEDAEDYEHKYQIRVTGSRSRESVHGVREADIIGWHEKPEED